MRITAARILVFVCLIASLITRGNGTNDNSTGEGSGNSTSLRGNAAGNGSNAPSTGGGSVSVSGVKSGNSKSPGDNAAAYAVASFTVITLTGTVALFHNWN